MQKVTQYKGRPLLQAMVLESDFQFQLCYLVIFINLGGYLIFLCCLHLFIYLANVYWAVAMAEMVVEAVIAMMNLKPGLSGAWCSVQYIEIK